MLEMVEQPESAASAAAARIGRIKGHLDSNAPGDYRPRFKPC